MDAAGEDLKLRNWLVGCMRNLDSILSAIILLEQAAVNPEDLNPGKDRNLSLFVEAWKMLIEKDPTIAGFIAAIVAMSFIIIFKVVAWTWFILIGVFITLLVGNLFEMITRKR